MMMMVFTIVLNITHLPDKRWFYFQVCDYFEIKSFSLKEYSDICKTYMCINPFFGCFDTGVILQILHRHSDKSTWQSQYRLVHPALSRVLWQWWLWSYIMHYTCCVPSLVIISLLDQLLTCLLACAWVITILMMSGNVEVSCISGTCICRCLAKSVTLQLVKLHVRN